MICLGYNINMHLKRNRGFTLIELLVVIAIISLLSSIVFASLNSARTKARDAKAISDFRQVKIALALYYDKYGYYPVDPDGKDPVHPSPVNTNTWLDNFNAMAQELVNEGFLGAIPVSSSGNNYNYYNYGGNIGGLMVVTLEAVPNTTTGVSPSCRPWPITDSSGNVWDNWCSRNDNSKIYCICNPY